MEVAMDIDSSAMKAKGKLRGEIDVAGMVYKQDGSVAARIGDAINLEFETPEQMDAFRKTPFHYSKEFSIAPGQYNVRIAVGSPDQAFGSIEKPLAIDPWGGETLAVSALALSDDDRPLPGLTAELDNETIEGPHRLGSGGRETMPMGGSEFRAGSSGYFISRCTNRVWLRLPRLRPLSRLACGFVWWIRVTGQEKADSGPMDAE